MEHAHRGLLPVASAGGWYRVCLVAAGAAVLAQIAYPLLSGTALTAVTMLAVVLFATAGVAHAAATAGPAAAVRLMLAAGGISLVAEAVGLRTGYPFGRYDYASSLGVGILGVPLMVLLAWTMMAYPVLLLARRLTAALRPPATPSRILVAGLGGTALASWDLFLDPQMVTGGFWTWHFPDPGLPGVPAVPLTNLAGWLLVGTLLTAVLDRLLPPGPPPADHTVPATLLAWTWLGSTLANLAFFGRPTLACYGFLALGATVAPYLRLLLRDARDAGRADTGGLW